MKGYEPRTLTRAPKYSQIHSVYILYILMGTVLAWKIAAADNLFMIGQSRSDILMSQQSSLVQTGTGLKIFLRTLEYLYFIFLGICLMNSKSHRIHISLFNFYILINLILIAFSSLFRSPIFSYILFAIFVNGMVYKSGKIFSSKFVILALMFPFGMSFLAFFRDGSNFIDRGLFINLLHGVSGFATVAEIGELIKYYSSNSFEFGYQFAINIITFVPRFLWADKPMTSFSFRLSEEIYGPIGLGQAWVHTFTILGEGYSQFGVAGMPMAAIIAAAIVTISFHIISRDPRLQVLGVFYFISMIMSFRGDLNAVFGRFFEFLIAILLFYVASALLPKRKFDEH